MGVDQTGPDKPEACEEQIRVRIKARSSLRSSHASPPRRLTSVRSAVEYGFVVTPSAGVNHGPMAMVVERLNAATPSFVIHGVGHEALPSAEAPETAELAGLAVEKL